MFYPPCWKMAKGQRHSHQTEAESFESLPPSYGFRHSFCQLIEFVVHDFSFLFFEFWLLRPITADMPIYWQTQ
jgi:hypothetical protein